MPSLFKQKSIAVLEQRAEMVDRQIESLKRFRERINRRIQFLRDKEAQHEPT